MVVSKIVVNKYIQKNRSLGGRLPQGIIIKYPSKARKIEVELNTE